MKKTFKKYVSGGMAAALLLTAMPVQMVMGAGFVNSDSVVEPGENAFTEDIESTADYPDRMDAAVGTAEDISENGRAGADSDDVTNDFTDEKFLAEVRKTLGLDEDKPVTKADCAKVTRLDVNGKGIESLAGIENLTELTSLDCSNNWLESLDVTKCTKLTWLWCGGNQLSTLDVSQCTELTTLRCGFYNEPNDLTSLDVSKCTKLQQLFCDNNFLTGLNVGDCPELRTIYCRNNRVTSLDVSNCPELYDLRFSDNQMTGIDLSNCTKLGWLDCGNNQLETLDISKCGNLEQL